MKPIEETMVIINLEKDHRKINTPKEIEILIVTSSRKLLNDVINGTSYPVIDYSLQLMPGTPTDDRSSSTAKEIF